MTRRRSENGRQFDIWHIESPYGAIKVPVRVRGFDFFVDLDDYDIHVEDTDLAALRKTVTKLLVGKAHVHWHDILIAKLAVEIDRGGNIEVGFRTMRAQVTTDPRPRNRHRNYNTTYTTPEDGFPWDPRNIEPDDDDDDVSFDDDDEAGVTPPNPAYKNQRHTLYVSDPARIAALRLRFNELADGLFKTLKSEFGDGDAKERFKP